MYEREIVEPPEPAQEGDARPKTKVKDKPTKARHSPTARPLCACLRCAATTGFAKTRCYDFAETDSDFCAKCTTGGYRLDQGYSHADALSEDDGHSC